MAANTFTQRIKVALSGAEKASQGANKVSKGMSNLAKSAMTAGAAYFGARGILNALKNSVEAFRQQEKAEKALETALGKTSTSLLAQASALQKVTMFGDEATIQQMAFLGSIGMTEKQIKEIIPVAMDLSAATGISLESAVRNTAKTFSGLAGELGELVPQLRDLTAEEMKAGKAVEVMADLFGGQATSATDTLEGSMAQFNNTLGDLGERLGESLAPSLKSLVQDLEQVLEMTGLLKTSFDINKKSITDQVIANMELQQQLEDVTEGSEEFFAIRDKIIKKFPVYFDGLDTEKIKIGDVNKLLEENNTLLAKQMKMEILREQIDKRKGEIATIIEAVAQRKREILESEAANLLDNNVKIKSYEDTRLTEFNHFSRAQEMGLANYYSMMGDFLLGNEQDQKKWQGYWTSSENQNAMVIKNMMRDIKDFQSELNIIFTETEDDTKKFASSIDTLETATAALVISALPLDAMKEDLKEIAKSMAILNVEPIEFDFFDDEGLQRMSNAAFNLQVLADAQTDYTDAIETGADAQEKMQHLGVVMAASFAVQKDKLDEFTKSHVNSAMAIGAAQMHTGQAAADAAGAFIVAKTQEAIASFIADAFKKFGILGGIIGAGASGVVGSLMSQGIKSVAAAEGMNEVVTEPTLILAGEEGAEYVNIEPTQNEGAGMGNGSQIIFQGNVLSKDFIEDEAIPMIRDAVRRGHSIA